MKQPERRFPCRPRADPELCGSTRERPVPRTDLAFGVALPSARPPRCRGTHALVRSGGDDEFEPTTPCLQTLRLRVVRPLDLARYVAKVASRCLGGSSDVAACGPSPEPRGRGSSQMVMAICDCGHRRTAGVQRGHDCQLADGLSDLSDHAIRDLPCANGVGVGSWVRLGSSAEGSASSDCA
jgi:hypothetical protein